MRRLNRVLVLGLALALLAGGALLAIEVVAAATGSDPVVVPWHGVWAAGSRDAWSARGTRVTSAAVLGAGVLLLLAQLWPRRVDWLVLERTDGRTDAVVTPREVAVVLRAAALTLDGIGSADVTVSGRRATVRATTNLHSDDRVRQLETSLAGTVTEALGTLGLAHPPQVRAHLASAVTSRDDAL